MNHSALSLVKLENNLAYDESLYLEEQLPPGAWEQPSLLYPDNFVQCTSSICNWDDLYQLPWHDSNMPFSEFKDFGDICWDFGMWPDVNKSFFEEEIIADAQPLNAAGEIRDQVLIENVESFLGEVSNNNNSMTLNLRSESLDSEDRLQSGRYKSSALQLDEIQKYFDVPITKAAKELNVGLTVLKKRCRELNIMRWPHRKIKSLKSLIDNAKALGLTSEIEMLEEHKRMLHRLPEMELTERTKKLRQACFKANYKKRRATAAAAVC